MFHSRAARKSVMRSIRRFPVEHLGHTAFFVTLQNVAARGAVATVLVESGIIKINPSRATSDKR